MATEETDYTSVPPPPTITDIGLPSDKSKPPTISDTHWERFQQLKKRRKEVHEKESRKRAKRMKCSSLKIGRQFKDSVSSDKEMTKSDSSSSTWDDIRPYLNTNTQFKDETHEGSSSQLGVQLEKAIERGRHDKASLLSDKISEQKFACQIVTAIDCHKFVEKKKEEESSKRKGKPLKWKYEHKKRWEMKGNM